MCMALHYSSATTKSVISLSSTDAGSFQHPGTRRLSTWSRSFTFLSCRRSARRDDARNGDECVDGTEMLFYGVPMTGRDHAGGAGRTVTTGLGLEREVQMEKEEPLLFSPP
ncbi:hypothetical protein GUJ93_ZPchr0015g6894 [Zizania palustris]|uniref:Uncharacterized protein n=1 Tax=Zizania palustris TaxID=103762 RepID=A0A8J5W0X8_ZIZPA|nr:hypothetical protein GUJ93_ZPchr0015g6894 [Zizania palustris]